MVEQGYYSNRIKELEERKAEVTGQLVTAKLSLQSIEKEIQQCDDAMQKLGTNSEGEILRLNTKINSLTDKLAKKDKELKRLVKTSDNDKFEIQNLTKQVSKLKTEKAVLKAENKNLKKQLKTMFKKVDNLTAPIPFSDVIEDSLQSENPNKVNIFEDIVLEEQYKKLMKEA